MHEGWLVTHSVSQYRWLDNTQFHQMANSCLPNRSSKWSSIGKVERERERFYYRLRRSNMTYETKKLDFTWYMWKWVVTLDVQELYQWLLQSRVHIVVVREIHARIGLGTFSKKLYGKSMGLSLYNWWSLEIWSTSREVSLLLWKLRQILLGFHILMSSLFLFHTKRIISTNQSNSWSYQIVIFLLSYSKKLLANNFINASFIPFQLYC